MYFTLLNNREETEYRHTAVDNDNLIYIIFSRQRKQDNYTKSCSVYIYIVYTNKVD